MRRTRFVSAFMLAMALVAMPALAAAAELSLDGTSTGTATAQAPEAGVAECNPTAATDPADFVCDFDLAGTFDLGEVGTGTYTGVNRLDWSIYTGAEPCAELTGTYQLTTADGTLEITLANTSRVCETPDPDVHESTISATITGGTGAYAGATGTVSGAGSMEAVTEPTSYITTFDMTGTITVPDPSAEPTVAPTATAAPSTPTTTAPSSAAPTPVADALPDTSSPGGMTGTSIIVLAVAFIGSLSVAIFRGRRLRI